MITLKDVKKVYGDKTFNKVEALKGVSINFRENEFVSILGPSGCGKSTLLNILGGLDKATSGEFIYDGISTVNFKDRDWDKYRNEAVSFVFQSYNLIPHLSVLANVEIALTVSGMTGEEKRSKAKAALEQVGLMGIDHKLPNQLSGGQMQRVAIARAIVNDSKILLADEPTGAIDIETSKQIMDILQELSKTRLVIMVTHNIVLANKYSTRIIELSDGNVISDTNPYTQSEEEISQKVTAETNGKKKKRFSTFNFLTAIKISWGNLIHKRGRSILTTIAGSIGIICMALILAVNNGFSSYIDDFEQKSLSKYPITVSAGTVSIMDQMTALFAQGGLDSEQSIDKLLDIISDKKSIDDMFTDDDVIRIQKQISSILKIMQDQQAKPADISRFKKYVDENFNTDLAQVKYDYSITMDIFVKSKEGYHQISPIAKSSAFGPIFGIVGGGGGMDVMTQSLNAFTFWDEILADTEVLTSQYSILAGHLPQNKNEVVLVLDEYNQISDFEALILEQLGLDDLLNLALIGDVDRYDMVFNDMLGKEFYVLPTSASYSYDEANNTFTHATSETDMAAVIEQSSIKVSISGILRNKEGVDGCINGVVGYTSELGEYIINDANSSEFVIEMQKRYEEYSERIAFQSAVLEKIENGAEQTDLTQEELDIMAADIKLINIATGQAMSEDSFKSLMSSINVRDLDMPKNIYFYPSSVSTKKDIVKFVEDYNLIISEEGEEAVHNYEPITRDYSVEYSDPLDGTVNELHELANTITFILLGVGSVSLLVTMLLIAIIMYIAVQDRTREIGILRSLGASKYDISKIFDVETIIIGLVSGIIGMVIAFILQFPGNLILQSTLNMSALKMAWWHPLVLILGSALITFVAGLIPASIAAKKEPVVALRVE